MESTVGNQENLKKLKTYTGHISSFADESDRTQLRREAVQQKS